jgi:hypothetical protein
LGFVMYPSGQLGATGDARRVETSLRRASLTRF